MINMVSFRNFKCLRDVRIELEPFTVFVGPNASGKSSALQALDQLCRAFNLDDARKQDAALRHNVSQGADEQIELAAESGGRAYRYRPGSPSPRKPSPQTARTEWTGLGRAVATSLDSPDWSQWKPEPGSRSPLPHSVLLRLEASRLVQPAPAGPDHTVMTPEGIGLHSMLASMALSDPDTWLRLQVHLQRIIPTIRRLRHTPIKPNQPSALLFDTDVAGSLSANQVSEGTLLVLGMLAALHAPERPSLILLDDVDRGLHPKAQKELISLLRELLNSDPDLQIVATTHSPYLLDCMEPNEVRMMYLENGSTVCASLTDHPKFQRWKDEFHAGEMWSLFGEKWLAEREAVAS